MNLFVLGDYNYGDPDTYAIVGGYLDDIHYGKEMVDKIITFDIDGVCNLASVWAYEEKVDFTLVGNPLCKEAVANSWFRKIVNEQEVDAFLFVFLEDSKDKERRMHFAIRDLFRRVQKTFKRQKVYTNKLLP